MFQNSKTMLFIFRGLLALILTASTINCSEKKDSPQKAASLPGTSVRQTKDSVPADTVLKYRLNRPVRYSALTTKKINVLKTLNSKYGPEGTRLILALNRLDEKDAGRSDTLIIPDVITNILSYSPYPYVIEALRSVPKIIFISRKFQAIAAYENGTLIKWGPTSTGRKAKPTPEGLFSMNWKSRKTTSTIDSSWVLPFYFNFYNAEGVALHQFDMPGYPASHACVRLLENDAKWFYYWAEQWMVGKDGAFLAHGTPIIVFDEYPWGKRRPWRNLLENPSAITITDQEIDSLMAKYLPRIKERVERRDSIVAELKEKKLRQNSPIEPKGLEIPKSADTAIQAMDLKKSGSSND